MRDAFGRFQRVLVLGGGSEIAHAVLDALLDEGPLTAVLAARSAVDASGLERRGAAVEQVEFDARAVETHAAALGDVFDRGDVDLVLLAAGILDADDPLELVATNFTGAASALAVVAARLRAQGHGSIAVLSSVAAVRPRRSNWIYGASKAGLDAFSLGLRLELAADGISVTVVRPGFVRTKMTAQLPAQPLAVGPERVAHALVEGVRAGKDVVWVPPAMRAVAWALRALPERALQRL